ncbi:MAG: DUF2249 domain-containing protein [Cyclobacteriaceae bacterium]|nr:DUF2249 domain-containing protein [Cyclobacteriaceae bacterium]
MNITPKTTIGAILKFRPEALESLVKLSPRFSKLKNPILRKLLAGRATVAMACDIGNCQPEEFFQALKSWGFTFDQKTINSTKMEESQSHEKLAMLASYEIVDLDVRPVLAGGTDPLHIILDKVNTLKKNQALKIINTFKPAPLITLLGKKGFEHTVKNPAPGLIETYFFKTDNFGDSDEITPLKIDSDTSDWHVLYKKYQDKKTKIDVRGLQPPQPMTLILEKLENLPDDEALLVQHEKIPVFLLPELHNLNYSYQINEESENQVSILIYKE